MKSVGMTGPWHIRKLKQACLAHTYTNFRNVAMLKSFFIIFHSLVMWGLNLTSCHRHLLLFQKACSRYNTGISKNHWWPKILLNMPKHNELHFGNLVLFFANLATKLCQTQIIFQVNVILSIKKLPKCATYHHSYWLQNSSMDSAQSSKAVTGLHYLIQ